MANLIVASKNVKTACIQFDNESSNDVEIFENFPDLICENKFSKLLDGSTITTVQGTIVLLADRTITLQ